jgi:hypothetical protein
VNFDLTTLGFFLISLIGGCMSVVTAGSFLIIIPSYILLGLEPLTALVMGRFFLIPSLGAGTLKFWQARKFRWPTITFLIFGGLIGTTLGAKLAIQLPKETFAALLPILIALAVPLIFFRPRALQSRHHIVWLLPLYGLLAGFFSSFGGAIGILTPVFLSWALSFDLKTAITHTRPFELTVNVFGFLAYLQFGAEFTTHAALPILAGALLGGWLGGQITLRTRPLWLKAAVATVGVVLLAKAFLV